MAAAAVTQGQGPDERQYPQTLSNRPISILLNFEHRALVGLHEATLRELVGRDCVVRHRRLPRGVERSRADSGRVRPLTDA